MTPQDRARLYNASPLGKEYPDSHFAISDRWILANWIMGNDYKSLSERGPDNQPFYGSYPPGYLKRVWPMFPDAHRIIHLFSGSLTKVGGSPPWPLREEVVLIDAVQRNVDVTLHDAEQPFSPWTCGADVIFADPPYSEQDAENYGRPLCNKKKVLAQCHAALRPGGLLLWMDQSIPMYAKINWKWVGIISMYRSTNHRIRGVMIFEKQ